MPAFQARPPERPEASLALQLAQLTAQMASRSAQSYSLQDDLLQARQLAEARDVQLQQLQQHLEAVEAALQQARREGAGGAEQRVQQLQQLVTCAAADKQQLQRRVEELRRQLTASQGGVQGFGFDDSWLQEAASNRGGIGSCGCTWLFRGFCSVLVDLGIQSG